MIQFDNLTVGYTRGKPVIDNLRGTLHGPGLHLLEGPNGVGKSTLLEALSGSLVPWSGSVLVDGRRPRHGRHGSVTLVRTEPAFLRGVTMRDHCLLFAGRDDTALDRMADAVEVLGLEGYLDQTESVLSSGTRKKFWTTLLLARQSPVLAIDEPFNAVDADSRDWICSRLDAESRERLVILVSHDVPPAWHAGDTVVSNGGLALRRLTSIPSASAATP
jgi:ABC-type multidrug transport system ATPase subunit